MRDDQKAEKRKIDKTKVIPLVAVVLVALGICFWFNRVFVFDMVGALLFHPTAEVTEVQNRLALTQRGEFIFKASRPALESREVFNDNCDSHDENVSVLGCYTGSQIHLYNIQSEDLVGVVESTAAHEMLHAVWKRMDTDEKKQLSELLLEVYNDERYHQLLAEDLGTYSELERIDELHSRIGTEIADLPEALEKHYARFFINQDLIVDYYDSYIEPFRELSGELENLTQELEELDEKINEQTEIYYQRVENLSKQIDEFNTCAETSGCFTTDTLFNATRNSLVAEQNSLEDYFNEINTMIERYNELVAEYNEQIIRGESLEKMINSNVEPEMVLE